MRPSCICAVGGACACVRCGHVCGIRTLPVVRFEVKAHRQISAHSARDAMITLLLKTKKHQIVAAARSPKRGLLRNAVLSSFENLFGRCSRTSRENSNQPPGNGVGRSRQNLCFAAALPGCGRAVLCQDSGHLVSRNRRRSLRMSCGVCAGVCFGLPRKPLRPCEQTGDLVDDPIGFFQDDRAPGLRSICSSR